MRFFLADQRGLVCFPRNARFYPPNVIENLELLWEAKKSKYASHYKWEPRSCGMIRGFKIWSQNLNRIIFDPLLA